MIGDRTLQRVLRSERLVALTGDLVRAILWVLAGAVLALWLAYYVVLARNMVVELHMNDFGKFYYSARAFLDGADMYGPTPATSVPVSETERQQFWNMNPPHFHLLVLPFAALPSIAALAAWAAASLAALVASVRMIGGALRWRWTPRSIVVAIAAGILCSATGMIVVTGQMTFLLMLPVTWIWIAARRGEWTRAAAALGALASVKPFFLLFALYFAATRDVRRLGAMAACLSACVVTGLAIFGWSAYASWLRALGEIHWSWAPMNASMSGLAARLFAESPFYVPLLPSPRLKVPVAVLASAAVVVTTLVVIVRDRSADHADRVMGGLLLAAQLASPLGWWYYVPLASGPLLACGATLAARRSRVRDLCVAAAVPGCILPFFVTLAWRDAVWAGATIGSLYGWTLLVLWAGVLADTLAARRRRC
jgi:hypothetical protein